MQVKETKLDTIAKTENKTVLNPRFLVLRALFVCIVGIPFGTRFTMNEWSATCFYFGILRRNDLQAISSSEQVFRYNIRATKDNKLTDADRFALLMSQVAGKRLTMHS